MPKRPPLHPDVRAQLQRKTEIDRLRRAGWMSQGVHDDELQKVDAELERIATDREHYMTDEQREAARKVVTNEDPEARVVQLDALREAWRKPQPPPDAAA